MRKRCLIEVLRGTGIADEDDVGGSGYVGDGNAKSEGMVGDAGMEYRSEDCVLLLLVETLSWRWYSGSSGLGGNIAIGGGFGAFKDNLKARWGTESRRGG